MKEKRDGLKLNIGIELAKKDMPVSLKASYGMNNGKSYGIGGYYAINFRTRAQHKEPLYKSGSFSSLTQNHHTEL